MLLIKFRKKDSSTEIKTVADRIRAMTNDELADLLTDDMCDMVCGQDGVSCNGMCHARVRKWLESEIA